MELLSVVLASRDRLPDDPARDRITAILAAITGLCVGHVRQFGGESPLCNLMEVKH
jgi:hypothetical protein